MPSTEKILRLILGHSIVLVLLIYLIGQTFPTLDLFPAGTPALGEEYGGKAVALAYLVGHIFHWITGECG
ncbi:MAG: hypothetical protein HY617_00170 [Candidatus Sungbacteria bacterium]|nr:hypothetical protein [Candidatus Sungbacteria bacterium]